MKAAVIVRRSDGVTGTATDRPIGAMGLLVSNHSARRGFRAVRPPRFIYFFSSTEVLLRSKVCMHTREKECLSVLEKLSYDQSRGFCTQEVSVWMCFFIYTFLTVYARSHHHNPNNKSRLSTSVSMALRHWCYVLIVYSDVHMWMCSKFQWVSVGFWAYLWVVKCIFKFPTKTWLVLVAERDVARVRQVAWSVSHDSSWCLRDHHELDTERWKFPTETCCDPVKKQLGQWVKLVTERPAVNLLSEYQNRT